MSYIIPWVPCDKELPKEEGFYEVTIHPHDIKVGGPTDRLYWKDGKWGYFYGESFEKWEEMDFRVIAWAYLPKQYKLT